MNPNTQKVTFLRVWDTVVSTQTLESPWGQTPWSLSPLPLRLQSPVQIAEALTPEASSPARYKDSEGPGRCRSDRMVTFFCVTDARVCHCLLREGFWGPGLSGRVLIM